MSVRLMSPPIQSTGKTCASHSISIWMLRKNVVLARDARALESRAARSGAYRHAGRVARGDVRQAQAGSGRAFLPLAKAKGFARISVISL